MYLGDSLFERAVFGDLKTLFHEFNSQEFRGFHEKRKEQRVNAVLLGLIQKAKEPCFLLSHVVDFIEQIARERVLENYSFSHFELWMNQLSGVTPEENYRVRAKVVGKWLPREEYQLFFPIGMNKVYPGSHFVTAHSSPDLDTTVASFWGWVDAFAARVSEGLHLWNVPGGTPAAQAEVDLLFHQPFGQGVFHHLAKARSALVLSSIDLLSQKGVVIKKVDESTLKNGHERTQSAIILVDEGGYYLGDWRSFDVEGIRQIIELLNHSLRWFANHLQMQLMALFSKKSPSIALFEECTRSAFALPIKEFEPAKRLTKKQRDHIEGYLRRVLGIARGLESTFQEFSSAMAEHSLVDFENVIMHVNALKSSSLFDSNGALKEDRPQLLHELEKICRDLDRAIQNIDDYVDRLAIALSIKKEVFGHLPQGVSYRADVEELRAKMGNESYLTVTHSDEEGRQVPLGVIHASELHKTILGTVSLRDFCNREETKIPSYFEVISVIDHHKGALSSLSPSMVLMADSQSSNALVAQLAFQINDKYSTRGRTAEEIKAELAALGRELPSASSKRIAQRLLQRLIVVERKSHFYVDTRREFIEYLQFLHAILDDTDFLTKVSQRDIECVVSLLNRLKSLMMKKEVEVIDLDDLVRDETFSTKAAKKILQNEDMSSLCRKIYTIKEEIVAKNLKLCAQGLPSTIFSDTKEQNGCCRVGQTKLFAKNFSLFSKDLQKIRKLWYEEALLVYQEKEEVDLHLHMVTTISDPGSSFSEADHRRGHRDEIWLWIPSSEQAAAHLRSFLNAFSTLPHLREIDMEVYFLGNNGRELSTLFKESFISVPHHFSEGETPMALLSFRAGAINSRKAMISPYLPHLVS